MAKLIYGLQQSLDGYVDHMKLGPPTPAAFRHFIDQTRDTTGLLYGTRMYEIMRYWDNEQPEWDAIDREFAAVWQSKPKWVVSRSLTSVGPNASLISEDLNTAAGKLKSAYEGTINVGGPNLAQSLSNAGLIDEYQLYMRPVVFGSGKPFFTGPLPPIRFVAHDLIADDLIRLTYVPAEANDR